MERACSADKSHCADSHGATNSATYDVTNDVACDAVCGQAYDAVHDEIIKNLHEELRKAYIKGRAPLQTGLMQSCRRLPGPSKGDTG